LVITSSKEEKSNLALAVTFALSAALHAVNFVGECIKLGVVNFNQSIRALSVSGLHTVTIFKEDGLVTFLLVPHTNILVDIKVGFGAHIRAPTPVPACLHVIEES